MIGTVTRLQYMKNRKQRSYGFLKGNNNQDYWFSLVGISEGTLNIGMTVSFEGERNEKGNLAVQVKPIT